MEIWFTGILLQLFKYSPGNCSLVIPQLVTQHTAKIKTALQFKGGCLSLHYTCCLFPLCWQGRFVLYLCWSDSFHPLPVLHGDGYNTSSTYISVFCSEKRPGLFFREEGSGGAPVRQHLCSIHGLTTPFPRGSFVCLFACSFPPSMTGHASCGELNSSYLGFWGQVPSCL